jgi:S-adenosylmethionine:tRNA ribosyltransferase-isomerase
MRLEEFDYHLPAELIAQRPPERRSDSRLLLLERSSRTWQDRWFRELPELLRGDELLVFNNTRVIPARLFGRREGVRSEPPGKDRRVRREYLSARIEVLLTRRLNGDEWEALVRPGRKVGVGERLIFGEGELKAEVTARGAYGVRRLRLSGSGDITRLIERLGHVPLPPYIERPDDTTDRERYQSIFAKFNGAVAAPTASLHFTPDIVAALQARGVELCELTLHVGLGTFQPIHAETIESHRMHSESYEIPEATAHRITEAKRSGRPVVAVGTTVVRALEDAARRNAGLEVRKGEAEIFIYPGHTFRVVDQMLTNFHLPKSSLLVLVSAFAGKDFVLAAYQHAIEQRYRFYSYGDCMLIR